MKIVTVSQASEMDRIAIEDFCIPEAILMENAAAAACKVIKDKYTIEDNNFILLCGTGNNGGDGLALARLLYSEGGAPLVLLFGSQSDLSGTAYANFKMLENFPIEIIEQFSHDRLIKELKETDIIIDALLGTGLNREITGNLKEIINTMNSSDRLIFSLDIPTGINGNTGQIMGVAVKADSTTSFGALKPGNLLYPGFMNNGELYLSRISFPPEIYDSDNLKMALSDCLPLPPRDETGHKKSFGNILTISGSGTYYGAPAFAASAVLKCGGGFSRLAAPRSMIPYLAAKLPESVFVPMDETEQLSIAYSNLSLLIEEAEKSDAIIIGPGLSLNNETTQLICEFIIGTDQFLIIDGDGLSAIAGKPELLSQRNIPAVLTPHLGEMSRLCAYSVSEISKNPINILKDCSKRYNSVIVLKGAHSLIGFPDGTVYVNMSGNSGLATAGSGDILTGIIAAFYGLGLSETECVINGVFIHGTAGDLTAEKLGKDGMTASDILKMLPHTMKEYRENYDFFIKKYRDIIHRI
ncbi:MAG: NAD(P)H-hydrate dehydratase [Spirochaetaceae bacterium]|jgi:hydroxyethylthiazole kinase-like uncharacterized protein yjeF|nr:NAD(P)H-hydrate dehydratase [Spirochaetaceae bacterium]